MESIPMRCYRCLALLFLFSTVISKWSSPILTMAASEWLKSPCLNSFFTNVNTVVGGWYALRDYPAEQYARDISYFLLYPPWR